jgi:hypothetical protein
VECKEVLFRASLSTFTFTFLLSFGVSLRVSTTDRLLWKCRFCEIQVDKRDGYRGTTVFMQQRANEDGMLDMVH